ncbi:FAD-dependent oxidoreductase [Desulfobacula toluolica]|uniref:Ion-translocating oxidoreductase complex subunit B n=1 Tax=Desulfobacula toluolica (strain DSM 7467 / Tol2) TaxID=651182 RepID=K0N5M9_DESTT|nr:FAD-dependent oxidoreductase [Desulfobacula toluolica]CCK79364.1 FAD-dependent oxidoreductase [Desulfobacula toluolica Tol2]
MFQSVLMMGGLGVAIGTALVIASKAFYVYEDPKVVAIDDALPGANCGGCGYPGCNANAEAIVNGLSGVNSCVAAGDDVAMAIAQIMGVSVSDTEPEFAGPGCYYGKDDADMEYDYLGITDCRAAALLFGGMKVCRIGCLGLGSCVKACMFGALSIGSDGLPKVDQEKCTGCGACERICPKNIIRLTSVTRRIMREYTTEECVTPCQRACPTGIDIKEYIRLIREGDYEASVQVIKERNPFPTVISRICPALCEFKCRRLLQDESVAINDLKRFVCDYEMNQNKRILPYKAPATDKQVAIIGGGVEGLSAAYFTARLGHSPTVFEATDALGGILCKAIARERLVKDVLDWDIEGIKEMGVTVKTHVKAGKDFTVDGLLKQGFHAVFTATGGWDSRLARGGVDQAETVFPGAYLLIDLLRSQSDKNITIPLGKNVVIAGGGIRVPDAVKLLKQSGSNKITIVSRKQHEDSSFDPAAIDILAKAGATIIYNAGVTRVVGEESNLTAIEYAALDTGEKQMIDADTLFIASGRFPELVFVPVRDDETDHPQNGQEKIGPLVWEGVELQKKPDTNMELGLLSSQDVISEYPSAVASINGGRKAAAAMHNLMYGIKFQESSNFITDQSILQDVTVLKNVDVLPRNIIKLNKEQKGSAGGGRVSTGFSTGFSTEQAQAEAARCLRCGLVCYEKSKIVG